MFNTSFNVFQKKNLLNGSVCSFKKYLYSLLKMFDVQDKSSKIF